MNAVRETINTQSPQTLETEILKKENEALRIELSTLKDHIHKVHGEINDLIRVINVRQNGE